MENCTRKVNSFAVTRSVYLMALFDWKLIKEEKKEGAPSTLYFERDENVPYYQEMVVVEKEISPKLIPFWVLLIPIGLAFALMTTLLILFLTRDEGFDTTKYFFAFFVPSMVLLLLDTGIYWFRSRQLMNYLNEEEKLVKQAEEKMQEIRQKYSEQN